MDLSDYKLVLEDDFNGDTLDLSKWEYRWLGERRGGFNSTSSVRVENGCLILRHNYRTGDYGEGWYGGMIRAKQRFLRGYFEIRCICNPAVRNGPWSAFWFQAEHPYDPEISRGGPGGAEIDIMESMPGPYYPGVMGNIHLAGKKGSTAGPGQLDSCLVGGVIIPDCASAFHTYALEWTETEYRFYADGECYAVSTWGDGVSEVPEELVVSIEVPENCSLPKDAVNEFIVDYIRVYQKG